MTTPWQILEQADPEIYRLLEQEKIRQRDSLELIASENFASTSVIAATGSLLTNKYAEGLPGKRYYGGCEHVDQVEQLAIDRAKKLFGANFANVQPHSGAQANAAVFLALLKAGDRTLGLDLSHGGHLTHGSKVNFSGQLYESHFYGLCPKTERLDYDSIAVIARKVKPKLIIAGASAYPRQIDFAKFRTIADEVGAYLLVDMAHIAGLVATGLHPSPIGQAHVVTTTTHKTLRGPRGGLMLWNDENLTKDLNKAVFPGTQGGPLEHVIAAKAVCFLEAAQPEFKVYQQAIVANTQALGRSLEKHGFKLISGGSDNHLVLVDLSGTSITGKQMEEALERIAITVNKNTVPNEQRSPFVTSGLRIGTPAVTTRGMGEQEMNRIAQWIKDVFDHIEDDGKLTTTREQVVALAREFALYPEWS